MPRPISFRHTIDAVRERRKKVTRRDAWEWLEEGTLLRPVEQVMGLEKGETQTPIFDDGTLIEVTDVRREPLEAIEDRDQKCRYCAGKGVFHDVVDPRKYDRHDSEIREKHGEDMDCIRCHGTGVRNTEVEFEGFRGPRDCLFGGEEFVRRFCDAMGVAPDDEITRIRFTFVHPD